MMNKNFLGIPRIIVFFIAVIVIPILAMQAYSLDTVTKRQISLENACTALIAQKPAIVVEVTPSPTATPSPTLRPYRLAPVSPVPATGGAK